MVEWLIAKYVTTYESLSAYTLQLRQVANMILENQFVLWMLVVLFVLLLRWLTQPRSDMTS